MKFVCESIEDILKPKSSEKIKKREDAMKKSHPEFYDFINYLISLNDVELASDKLHKYLNNHPFLTPLNPPNYRDFIDKFYDYYWGDDLL
jgi:hypothetical protein